MRGPPLSLREQLERAIWANEISVKANGTYALPIDILALDSGQPVMIAPANTRSKEAN